MTVQQLRDNGYKVSVAHYRLHELDFDDYWIEPETLKVHTLGLHHQRQLKKWNKQPVARGGMTFVTITTPDEATATAYAACSMSDNYCKKTGREIAIGRALKKLRDGGDTF